MRERAENWPSDSEEAVRRDRSVVLEVEDEVVVEKGVEKVEPVGLNVIGVKEVEEVDDEVDEEEVNVDTY